MTGTHRVVIVGASIAGLTTAETLREEGYSGRIVLIGEEPHLPYSRPPLSKQILAGEWEPGDATIRMSEEFDRLDIDLRVGLTATALDVGSRVVHAGGEAIAFDELVIATGTEPRVHEAAPMALTLRTMEDALRLRSLMKDSTRVAVIGAGILGSEIASAARKRGAEALLIGRSGALTFGSAGTLLSDELVRLHSANGVELALSGDVQAMRPAHAGRHELVLADGRTLEADLVVAMIGGSPRTAWLASSSLDIGAGVVCDSRGAAAPGVWAVGDVAAWNDPVTGEITRVEHQSYAIEQAISVGTRIARAEDTPYPTPLFWSEIHGTRITAFGRFARSRPLIDMTDVADERGRVFGSTDAEGHVLGVVGWNATPRSFRAARAAVAAPFPLRTA